MTKVNLRASGYTWKCPECEEKDNYTGAPPEKVTCKNCKGEFEVGELCHRRRASKKGEEKNQSNEFMPLFGEDQFVEDNQKKIEEIPF